MKMKAWIAKDRGSATVVYLYDKPYKRNDATWGNLGDFFVLDDAHVDIDRNLMSSWKDSEPIEVEINITKASDNVVAIPKDRYERLLQYEQEYISRQSMINSFMQNK